MNFAERVFCNIRDISKTVAFIGAGMSIKSGLLSWEKLMLEIIKGCEKLSRSKTEIEYFKLLHEERNYILLMQYIYDRIGELEYLHLLGTVFDRKTMISEEHELLVKIPFAGYITTNCDKLIETAYIKDKNSFPFSQNQERDDIIRLLSNDKQFVFKLHGSIDKIDKVVFRKEQYDDLAKRDDIKNLFRKYLLEYQFIFLGYSFRDPDLDNFWDLLNSECRFKAPALLISQKDNFDTYSKNILKQKNVLVFEPDNQDEEYKYNKCILKYILEHHKVEEQSIVQVDNSAALLETSLMLIDLFDDHHISNLYSFLKSITISLLLKNPDMRKLRELTAKVCDIVQLEGDFLMNILQNIYRDLQSAKNIVIDGDKLTIKPKINKYAERSKIFTGELNKMLNSALLKISQDMNVTIEHKDLTNFKELFYEIITSLGKQLSENILYYKRYKTEDSEINNLIKEYIKHNDLKEKYDLYRDSFLYILNNSSDEEEKILFKMIQMYFLTNAYTLNPKSERLLKEYVSQFVIYFDSNIVLQGMAKGHPNHNISFRVIDKTRKLNMKMYVLDVIFKEIVSHTQNAIQKYSEITGTSLNSIDALESYIQLVGSKQANVFLTGYYKLINEGTKLSWEDYMAPFCSHINGNLSIVEETIKNYLDDVLSIEVDSMELNQKEIKELNTLTQSIITLRKHGNRYVNDLLCRDEAKQFLVIYFKRIDNMLEKVWFISNDHFITELYEQNKDKYSLPCNYTPLSWYQYLQLLDYDARASKNFSKLFMFSEIGALDDELALETIKMMSEKERKFIKRGALSASTFANELVRKYHIKSIFNDYWIAKKDGRADKNIYKEKIKSTIDEALDDYVLLKTSDVQKQQEIEKELLVTQNRFEKEKFKRRQAEIHLKSIQNKNKRRKKK